MPTMRIMWCPVMRVVNMTLCFVGEALLHAARCLVAVLSRQRRTEAPRTVCYVTGACYM